MKKFLFNFSFFLFYLVAVFLVFVAGGDSSPFESTTMRIAFHLVFPGLIVLFIYFCCYLGMFYEGPSSKEPPPDKPSER